MCFLLENKNNKLHQAILLHDAILIVTVYEPSLFPSIQDQFCFSIWVLSLVQNVIGYFFRLPFSHGFLGVQSTVQSFVIHFWFQLFLLCILYIQKYLILYFRLYIGSCCHWLTVYLLTFGMINPFFVEKPSVTLSYFYVCQLSSSSRLYCYL